MHCTYSKTLSALNYNFIVEISFLPKPSLDAPDHMVLNRSMDGLGLAQMANSDMQDREFLGLGGQVWGMQVHFDSQVRLQAELALNEQK